jgi:hypothetical protein
MCRRFILRVAWFLAGMVAAVEYPAADLPATE